MGGLLLRIFSIITLFSASISELTAQELNPIDSTQTHLSDTIPDNREHHIRLGLPNRQDSINMGLIFENDDQDSVEQNSVPLVEEIMSIPFPDSITIDSSEKKRKGLNHFLKHDYPNPRKAFFLSLAIPGGGQLYNQRYWKLPFVYAIIGGAGYSIYFNTTEYRRFRTAYENRITGIPDEFEHTITNLQTLKSITDTYRSNMELSYVFLIGGYLFTAAEALVDAHLKTFNVSDDLSIKIKPSFHTDNTGVGLVFSF